MSSNFVYLAVGIDKYELPIALLETIQDACKFSNKSKKTFNSSVCKRQVDRIQKCRYVRVCIKDELEGDDEK